MRRWHTSLELLGQESVVVHSVVVDSALSSCSSANIDVKARPPKPAAEVVKNSRRASRVAAGNGMFVVLHYQQGPAREVTTAGIKFWQLFLGDEFIKIE